MWWSYVKGYTRSGQEMSLQHYFSDNQGLTLCKRDLSIAWLITPNNNRDSKCKQCVRALRIL